MPAVHWVHDSEFEALHVPDEHCVQTNEAPICPFPEYPAVHVHVEAPAVDPAPVGQAVQAVDDIAPALAL